MTREGLSELQLEASVSRPSSASTARSEVPCNAEVAQSPLRGGGGHSARSPRPSTPVRLTLEEALRTSRQVSISLREGELDTAGLADDAPFDAPAGACGSPMGQQSPSPTRVVADCGVTSEIGARPENQDGWILRDQFGGHAGAVFAAVLDGHGPDGRRVSQFVQAELPLRLSAQPGLTTDPPEALRRAFAETQAALLAPESGLQTECSGATATCVLVVRRKLHVANLGDSRTVLGFRRARPPGAAGAGGGAGAPAGAEPAVATGASETALAARRLTTDHKPDEPAERARIEASGGRVCPFMLRGKPLGPPRVWSAADWTPGLAVARSFGDSALAALGVSAVPEIGTYELDSSFDHVVLASDGVWDGITDDEAVAIVAQSARAGSPQAASAELCRRALVALHSATRKDNVTALVVTFASGTSRRAAAARSALSLMDTPAAVDAARA
ncbi:hypothetical protein KFE25_012485 [Diacronema lutheri]|uniref:PPM-type phosphatase domain-containing protein n=2 Tax=Diacronema lutheri TaxID=2081491 RepID=A0A8J5XNE6_DIALT|nr:hypothetical protein KFE25_012485 [Diacronema lutheri]